MLREAAEGVVVKKVDIKETKDSAIAVQKVNYELIVQNEVATQPWIALLNDPTTVISKFLSGAVLAFEKW